jgi:hypothetical protein
MQGMGRVERGQNRETKGRSEPRRLVNINLVTRLGLKGLPRLAVTEFPCTKIYRGKTRALLLQIFVLEKTRLDSVDQVY